MAIRKLKQPYGVRWPGKGRARGKEITGIAYSYITPGSTNQDAMDELLRRSRFRFLSDDIRFDPETFSTHRLLVVVPYSDRSGKYRTALYAPNVKRCEPVVSL